MRDTVDNRVEVWVRSLDNTRAMPFEFLGEDEREHLARLRQPLDRRRFLAGRSLLRAALARRFGATPSRWRFARLETGKWVVSSGPCTGVDFSVSHAGGAVAVSVTRGSLSGIDIEPHATGAELTAIDYLTGRERAWLEALPAETRRREALRIWTAKEAYAKALGRGVDFDFASFDAGTDFARRRILTRDVRVGGLRYSLSVAVIALESQTNPAAQPHRRQANGEVP